MLPTKMPLLVRPGARFDCFGDGLCCTDIHAIGALSDEDCEMINAISEEAVAEHTDGARVLLMCHDTGGCVFLQERGCAIHSSLGADAKPTPCLRYPFGLTATPQGGRITTQHRCPCRTLGDRPPLTGEASFDSISDAEGELAADHAVGDSVQWSAEETISFDDYTLREKELIARALDGERLMVLLGADPFPALVEGSWEQVTEEMTSIKGTTRLEEAIKWFGDALGALLARTERVSRQRPWAHAFDKAEARIQSHETPTAVFADWLTDNIWGLHWTDWGSFARARAELATRLVIARRLAAWRIEDGAAEDVAAAEAIMIVETVGHSDWWEDVQRAIDLK